MTGETGNLTFFDANAFVGTTNESQPSDCLTTADLLREMDRVGIAEALVYHSLSYWHHAPVGNARLVEELRGADRLHPCWVLLPHQTGELPPPPQLIEEMRAAGVRAARVFPNRHLFPLEPWCFGATLEALSAARIPLLIDFGKKHWSEALPGWREVHSVCSAVPELKVIVVHEGAAINRIVFPLLEQHRNLHLEISSYQTHLSLETVAQRYGAQRLLFGTGLPEYAPGRAKLLVSHCLLSDDERAAIAGNNLRALLGLGGD